MAILQLTASRALKHNTFSGLNTCIGEFHWLIHLYQAISLAVNLKYQFETCNLRVILEYGYSSITASRALKHNTFSGLNTCIGEFHWLIHLYQAISLAVNLKYQFETCNLKGILNMVILQLTASRALKHNTFSGLTTCMEEFNF